MKKSDRTKKSEKVISGETNSGGTLKNNFLQDSIEELKRVTYPTKQEAIRASMVTVVFVVFFALILALFDILFRYVTTILI
jgi:preprotein translocase SecE subunit